jgi:hypothetical protein
MAHFAQLDQDNIVTRVIVVHNNELLDGFGVEQETKGVQFCQSLFGADTIWAQTSYNATFRKNYAGIGYKFDVGRNAFIPPKPFASWILDEDTCLWKAPVDKPTDGNKYAWEEETTSWVVVTE